MRNLMSAWSLSLPRQIIINTKKKLPMPKNTENLGMSYSETFKSPFLSLFNTVLN